MLPLAFYLLIDDPLPSWWSLVAGSFVIAGIVAVAGCAAIAALHLFTRGKKSRHRGLPRSFWYLAASAVGLIAVALVMLAFDGTTYRFE